MPEESYEESQLYKIRHSAAHVMAEAMLERFPEAKIAIGPPIEDGFYYDFAFANGHRRRRHSNGSRSG